MLIDIIRYETRVGALFRRTLSGEVRHARVEYGISKREERDRGNDR